MNNIVHISHAPTAKREQRRYRALERAERRLPKLADEGKKEKLQIEIASLKKRLP